MHKICFPTRACMICALVAGLNGSAMGAPSAEQDFAQLSNDGVSAFNDIHLARIDLFDGRTREAEKLTADALASLQAARSGKTIVKPESALHAPPLASQAQHRLPNGTAPVVWVPIDGELVLADTGEETPAKAAAIVNANKNLEKGDTAKALAEIRGARLNVNYVLSLAPLEPSIAEVTQANRLMSNGDYYAAGQALREAESGIAYDQNDDVGNSGAGTR